MRLRSYKIGLSEIKEIKREKKNERDSTLIKKEGFLKMIKT